MWTVLLIGNVFSKLNSKVKCLQIVTIVNTLETKQTNKQKPLSQIKGNNYHKIELEILTKQFNWAPYVIRD